MSTVLFPSIHFILSATRGDMYFILSSPSEEEGKKPHKQTHLDLKACLFTSKAYSWLRYGGGGIALAYLMYPLF